MNKKMIDVLIIGAGPAGLSAGLYSARAGAKTAVVENLACGGQVNLTPDVYNVPGVMKIGGAELGETMRAQAEKAGCEIIYDDIKEIDFKKKVVMGYENTIQFHSLIIATGVRPRNLAVARAEDFVGNGIHFCGLCDGAFYKGRNLVVVGGGNSAVEEAIYLSSLAKSVTIVTDTEKLMAQAAIIKKLDPKIKIYFNSGITEICGGNKITSVILKDGKEIQTDGIFVAIGRVPNTEMFTGKLELNDGYIVVNNEMRTSLPHVFAAGDVVQKPIRQIITACADGAIAATFAARK